MPSNDVHSEELREQIEEILATNMPIHAEHAIDERNILNNVMQLISTHTANAVREAEKEWHKKRREYRKKEIERNKILPEAYRRQIYLPPSEETEADRMQD